MKPKLVFVFKNWLLSSLWVQKWLQWGSNRGGQGMLHGRGHRRAQQAHLTPGSFIQRKRSQSEEAALQHPTFTSEIETVPPHTCGPSVSSIGTGCDGCEHAGMMRRFQRKTTAATSSARMIKWNLKSTDPQKSVPLLTHIWNFLFPQLNYIVINFVNNNYIFHYRIARKGRCKTLSQDSPLSCLCLFVYSIKY